MPDLSAVKTRQQATWASGDFAAVGSTMQLMAELLAEALDLRSGSLVLDVAAGNGNSTLAAARRGCRVTSTDYVPALLERGRMRAEAEGWNVSFQTADAEALPFADASFDYVVSTVGVMFTPDQPRAAAELFRVCRPGGRIGLANWTPAGFVGRIFRIVSGYLPPPSGIEPPSLWGTAEHLRQLFPRAREMSIVNREANFRALSTERWLAFMRTFYGPLHQAMAALDEANQNALSSDLLALANELNRAEDGTMVAPSEYLEVVIGR